MKENTKIGHAERSMRNASWIFLCASFNNFKYLKPFTVILDERTKSKKLFFLTVFEYVSTTVAINLLLIFNSKVDAEM